jgi:thiol-disulfide isomerase/thioredoxin
VSKIIKIKSFIIIVLLIILPSFFTGCLNNSSEENEGDNKDLENVYVENFTFTLLDGNKKSTSEYQGNVVVLDLFGVNCQPCQFQMMVMDQISKNYSSKGVKIISIDVWIVFGETPGLVKDFIDEFKAQLDIVLDWTFGVDNASGTIFYKYVPADKGIPMLYILDKNGNIYYSHAGYMDYSSLSTKIDGLLE